MKNLAKAALAALLCALAGCRASAPPAQVQAPARHAHVAQRVDAQAQQRAYEQGVEFFSSERYAQARGAWQAAMRMGPRTELGVRARNHLANVESILKGLQEIESE